MSAVLRELVLALDDGNMAGQRRTTLGAVVMLPSAAGQALGLGAGTRAEAGVWKQLLAPDGVHPESDDYRCESKVDDLNAVSMRGDANAHESWTVPSSATLGQLMWKPLLVWVLRMRCS